MKSFSCKDVGVSCDYTMTGKDEKEILEKAKEHAKKDHGMDQIPDDLLFKVKGAIKDIPESKAERKLA